MRNVFGGRPVAHIGAALIVLSAALIAVCAPASAAATPVLTEAGKLQSLKDEGRQYPLWSRELTRTRAWLDAFIAQPISVPVPKDPDGGFTHSQHKANYHAIYAAGLLYRITGEKEYADFARRMLLAYADLYPRLGRHPAARGKDSGRLFWQPLNDAVWLVYAVQGYDAVRDAIPASDRERIDADVFRRMARFLSDDSPEDFNRIHNHATWSTAGVGMTGYVLRDAALVRKALYGTDGTGKGGFLRQIDLLFSPDGYYTEGPYYQRYALQPFVMFARSIDLNEPQRKIFAYRDGVLLKAVRAELQFTYQGYIFPLNDSVKEKGIWTDELYQAVAIAYAKTQDDTLLSIAEAQNRTILTPDGLTVAEALAQGRAKPFPQVSGCYRDGAAGEKGALAILRADAGDMALVMKNTAQGMGHGHFDKLSWVLYDNGGEVIADYGAARYLNVKAKDGGRYLPENQSWAKQTVAHNTLVVDETSHFKGDWRKGEAVAPTQLVCKTGGDTQVVAARMHGAYPHVDFSRTLIVLRHPDFALPVVVDLLKARGTKNAQYDLPLYYHGQIMTVGFPVEQHLAERPVLGKANGYQFLWLDAVGKPDATNGFVSWMLNDRFYTYRFVPPAGSQMLFVESGANDPNFNVRREPALIQRVAGVRDVDFVALLEPHGQHDGNAETTVGEESQVKMLEHVSSTDGDLVRVVTVKEHRIVLAVANSADPAASHRIEAFGRVYEWKGYDARFDE